MGFLAQLGRARFPCEWGLCFYQFFVKCKVTAYLLLAALLRLRTLAEALTNMDITDPSSVRSALLIFILNSSLLRADRIKTSEVTFFQEPSSAPS